MRMPSKMLSRTCPADSRIFTRRFCTSGKSRGAARKKAKPAFSDAVVVVIYLYFHATRVQKGHGKYTVVCVTLCMYQFFWHTAPRIQLYSLVPSVDLNCMRFRQGLYATGARGENIEEKIITAAKKSRFCFCFVPLRAVSREA